MIPTFTIILTFIFGAIIGSFLNVVSLRFNTGKSINGRSGCMSCGKQLTWRELIPIFSFIFQRGKCKKCKSKISWQYPLVEVCAGIFFALIFVYFPPVSTLTAFSTIFYVVVTCLLLVIAAYDIKHKIIPDEFVYTFAIVAFAGLFIGGSSWLHTASLSSILAGPLLALPFALLWLFSNGTWMGLGDSKLILGIGWVLGLNRGANAIILAFWIAAAISVTWLFATYGSFKLKKEIPFGPYLILGMYLVLFFGIQAIDFNLVREIILSYL